MSGPDYSKVPNKIRESSPEAYDDIVAIGIKYSLSEDDMLSLFDSFGKIFMEIFKIVLAANDIQIEDTDIVFPKAADINTLFPSEVR